MTAALRTLRALMRDRTGGSALEFALVAMPFILVLLGAFEFSRMVFYKTMLSNATAAAARTLLLDSAATPDALKAYMSARIVNVDMNRLRVSFSDISDGGVTYRTVATEYDFDFIVSTLFDFAILLSTDTVVPLL